ncbi:hypothetical protein DENSPDRAFT_842260 [Dentipellis sp. KUC8613]|nr:hypothetical protein DENSPDRAFT_842260 [Dentipellis sp. KUC8613]
MLNRRKSRPSIKADKEHAGLPPFECEFDFEKLKANLLDKSKDPVSPICTGNDSIIHSGTVLYRREDEGLFGAWNELFLVLTNNHLLIAEPKQEGDTTRHSLITRPILLDLLVLSNFTDSPTKRILAGYFNILKHTGVKQSPPASPLQDALSVYPFTIGSASGRQGDYTLYVETAQVREDWKHQLEAALRRRELEQASSRAFEIKMFDVVAPIIPESDGETRMGKANCAILWATNDDRELIALGCDEGVWIGLSHKPKSLRRVLRVKSVTQIALMKDCGMFLVLTENTLLAYHIESLVPSSPHNHNHTVTQTPQKLSRANNEVLFFAMGYLEHRTLVIYTSKKDNGSVFRVLEPDYIRIGNSAAGDPHLNGQQPNWFRIYRDFFLPSECRDLAFLDSELAILCKTGFELMDWSNFANIVIPRSGHPQHSKLLSTCASSRPLAIFQCPDNDLLLCYDELGLYVNQAGDPNPAKQPIEWESAAERIVRHGEYILLFNAHFVEVHDLETGKLCQIIRGERLRCICGAHNAETTARVYGTMGGGDAEDGEGQRIFELAPVVRQARS